MEEIWKDIKDYEGLYQVSNFGRVKSIYRIRIQHINEFGYYRIVLSKNSKLKTFSTHRLIAEVFLENPNNLPEINHKDGNKQNNCVSNLEWCTSSYNQIHAFKTGLQIPQCGIQRYNAKLTETQILEIRQLKDKHTQTEIGKMYGISFQHVSDIQNKKKWKHI